MKLKLTITLAILMLSTTLSAQELKPVDPTEYQAPESAQTEIIEQQPTIAPPAPMVPTITAETRIFKRTPLINGDIEPGEWDQHFAFSYAGVQVWTYVNWDDNNLYIASKSSSPTNLLITLDANNDSWFHGSDNYEFVARHGLFGESPTLSVSRYESQRMAKDRSAPLTAAEAAKFKMKAGSTPDGYVYEIAIPKDSVTGLVLKPGKPIGLKVSVGIGDQDIIWIPEAPLGEVQSTELVALKSSSSGLGKVAVELRNAKVPPGEELVAKITIKNDGASILKADTVVIGGEGKTSKLLGSQLVRLEGIKPRGVHSTTFRSMIPTSAVPGSYAVGVEVRASGERIASSLVSFDVVPSYVARIDTPNAPTGSNDFVRVPVVITNNTSKEAFGRVKLSVPQGWTHRWGSETREFKLRRGVSEDTVVFRVVPPAKAKGKIPVLAEITIGDEKLSVSGMIDL